MLTSRNILASLVLAKTLASRGFQGIEDQYRSRRHKKLLQKDLMADGSIDLIDLIYLMTTVARGCRSFLPHFSPIFPLVSSPSY